jgi:hypothetical protein
VDLEALFKGSFVNWETVAGSWSKRTVPSRLLLFSARRYLKDAEGADGAGVVADPGRAALVSEVSLPDEIRRSFASAPPVGASGTAVGDRWGEFVDAALAAELEMISYGERPPLLHELRAGLEEAAGRSEEEGSPQLARWFRARSENLPGGDLPDSPGYLPI